MKEKIKSLLIKLRILKGKEEEPEVKEEQAEIKMKDSDDYLKKIIKAVIISKNINIYEIQVPEEEKYLISPMCRILVSDEEMTVDHFNFWMKILNCTFSITVENKEESNQSSTKDESKMYDISQEEMNHSIVRLVEETKDNEDINSNEDEEDDKSLFLFNVINIWFLFGICALVILIIGLIEIINLRATHTNPYDYSHYYDAENYDVIYTNYYVQNGDSVEKIARYYLCNEDDYTGNFIPLIVQCNEIARLNHLDNINEIKYGYWIIVPKIVLKQE